MKDRYSRQLSVDGFGQKAQDRLADATVAVVGLGGLGCPACQYLAAAGVGGLIIIDDQRVEVSDLNRQVLHFEEDALLPRYKVESARNKLKALNSEVMVEALPMKVEDGDLFILKGADVILDCLDDPEGRYLLNRHCLSTRTPMVHGAVEGMRGHVLTLMPGGPCLRCAFPQLVVRRGPVPVLGAAAGVIGAMQAMETMRLITGVGGRPDGRALFLDLRGNELSEVQFVRDPVCPDCSSF